MRIGWWVALSVVLLAFAVGAAEGPRIGDKVQIKMGETWVDATVTDVEGQRVRAKVAAGVEAWFGPGDYRAGAAGVKTESSASTGGEKPKPAAPAPRPAMIVVGQRVETAFAGTWLPAKVLARDGDRTKVKLESGMELWQGPEKVRTIVPADPRFFSGLAAGTELLASDRGTWREATVVAKEGNKVKVHFKGFGDVHDAWLEQDKVRQVGATLAGAGGGGAAASAQTGEKPAPSADVPRGDLSGVRELAAEKETVAWTVKPDPAAEPGQKPATGPLPLGLKPGERDVVEQIFFAPAPVPTATVVFYEDAIFDNPSRTRLVKMPLAGGRAPERADLGSGVRLMDVSPDAARVIVRLKSGELPNVLQVAALGGGKVTPTVTWKPYREEGELTLAAFVDASHVLTCDKEGSAILWQLSQGAQPKGVYRLKVGNQVRPVLSPGRRVLAAEAFGGLRFWDALTGAPLGGVEDLSVFGGSVTFRQDGGQVAYTSGTRMSLIDLNGGKVVNEIPLLPEFTRGIGARGTLPGWGTSAEFLPGGYLLVGRRFLIAASQRMVEWDYRFPLSGPGVTFAGLTYYVAPLRDGTGQVGLYSTRLPHDAAAKAIAANPTRIEDLLVLRPGTNVVLDVGTDAPGDLRPQIAESLRRQLDGMGCRVAPGANVRVGAWTEAGETKPVTYHVFGRGQQTVNVTGKIHRVTVEENGKVVWDATNRIPAPLMVAAKQGQSMEEAVRAEMERTYHWFTTVRIPRDIVRPELYKVLGASAVGTNGVEAVKEKP